MTNLTMSITGALRYTVRASVPARAVRIIRDRHGRFVKLSARLQVRGEKGGTATLVYSLAKGRKAWAGSILITDRRARMVERFAPAGAPKLGRGGVVSGSARARLGRRIATLRFQLKPATVRAAAASRALSANAAMAMLAPIY